MRNSQNQGARRVNGTIGRLTNGLGWFSIGLGVAEVVVPGAVAGLIGVQNQTKTRKILRFYGLREIAAGVGILTRPQPSGSMWARVAGDTVDLASLISAAGNPANQSGKLGFAIASVAAVTAADVYCAQQLSTNSESATGAGKNTHIVRTIIIDRPAEEAYKFWHDFQNLPRFMTYLESVRNTGDRRTHWIASGLAGSRIEWDAELVTDEPNRTIGWRSLPGSTFEHTGSVRFEPAPGGRGTLVRAEIDYSPNRGAALLGKVLQMDLGRRVMHDLRNFKQVLEVGEVTQSDASVHSGMHAAQPEPEPAYQH